MQVQCKAQIDRQKILQKNKTKQQIQKISIEYCRMMML